MYNIAWSLAHVIISLFEFSLIFRIVMANDNYNGFIASYYLYLLSCLPVPLFAIVFCFTSLPSGHISFFMETQFVKDVYMKVCIHRPEVSEGDEKEDGKKTIY
jgi:hypothetical protein